MKSQGYFDPSGRVVEYLQMGDQYGGARGSLVTYLLMVMIMNRAIVRISSLVFMSSALLVAPVALHADYRDTQAAITKALQENSSLGHYDVSIEVRRDLVVLRGEVSSIDARRWIEATALEQKGVARVDNLLVVVERRVADPSQNSLADRIIRRIRDAGGIDGADLTVRTRGADVILNGTVPSAALSEQIEQIAFATEGVASVKNELAIAQGAAPEQVRQRVSAALQSAQWHGVRVDLDGPTVVLSGDLESHRAVDEVLAMVLMVDGVEKIRSNITVDGHPYPR